MKIEIKNRFDKSIILCGEYESIRDCLENNTNVDLHCANLQGANLQGANLQGASLQRASLQGASLQGANLQDASLQGAYLQGAYLQDASLQGAYLHCANLQGANLFKEKLTKEPIQILGLDYFILIISKTIKIGCKVYTVEEWKKFTDEEILKMDGEKGLKFWKTNKTMILNMNKLYNKAIDE